MKIIFFDKVIFEGTAEECEAYKQEWIKTLGRLDDELQDTYPMKATDTNQTYFEALKILNPFVYETLSSIKEMVGDHFIEFYFYRMDLAGVKMRIYADLETRKTKMCALSYIYFILVFELDVPAIWRIEE